jgi:phosphatidylinositol alpha 1,6-mannosyltransferase
MGTLHRIRAPGRGELSISPGSRRTVLRAGVSAALPLLAAGLSACARGEGGMPDQASAASRPSAPLVPPITYVALGASDAVGWGTARPRRDGWVPVLARQLPQPTQVVNLGVPAITLGEALEETLPQALAARPDLVTVWLVVNDIISGVRLDQYRADLDRLLARLRTSTEAVIAIGNVPKPPARLGRVELPDIARRTVTAAWNGAIAALARQHAAILVDLYARWQVADHPEYLGPDGLHPTAEGHQTLARTFLQALQEQRLV